MVKTVEYCPKCKGTGDLLIGENETINPCNRCSGDGQLEVGFVDSDSLEADIAKILKFTKKIMAKIGVDED